MQRIHQLHVRINEIGHVYVVALSRTILRGERVAHHLQLRPQPLCNIIRGIHDPRETLVRHVLEVRTDPAGRVGTDHVEVAEQRRRERLQLALARIEMLDDRLFRLQLGHAVRVGRPLRRVLSDWKLLWRAKRGTRRREDELIDSGTLHRAQQRHGRDGDVLKVVVRRLDRLAHIRIPREVHHELYPTPLKEVLHGKLLRDVELLEVDLLLAFRRERL
mmetsp:Transcript_53975/g.124263  ORF Transcript_53975/g.124263 Transcript_53975/m.124263 type:complete len:218 (+) Transcript_53975:443-1096(+)